MERERTSGAPSGVWGERWPVLALVLSLALLGLCALDAARRHGRAEAHARARTAEALSGLLGTPDLAISSSSRWLRHPSLVEPAAAAADGPAILDTDPAGALLPPDRRVLRQSTRPLTREDNPR